MTRNRASARKAGASFESLIAGYFAAYVDDRIERRTKNGSKDRGDVSGLRHRVSVPHKAAGFRLGCALDRLCPCLACFGFGWVARGFG